MSWWANATEDEKMTQVLGGIDLGMSASQIARNVGATATAVYIFAHLRGVSFRTGRKDRAAEDVAVEKQRTRGRHRAKRLNRIGNAGRTTESAMLAEGFRMLSMSDYAND